MVSPFLLSSSLPSKIRNITFCYSILLKVCNFLRSRALDIRNTARDTLVKILTTLGTRFFPYILYELKGTLKRGYQRHVLCYTVHQLLKKMEGSIQPGDIDVCLKTLQEVCRLNTVACQINPYLMNGFSHHYHLGESTFIFRGGRCDFKILLHFSTKFLKANRIASDGAPHSVVSHLGLYCCLCPTKGMPSLNVLISTKSETV